MLIYLIVMQLLATLVMTGVIWFVQLVHYPLYALVGKEHFVAYQRIHLTMTVRIVGPMMLLECVSTRGLVCVDWGTTPLGANGRIASWAALALFAVIGLVTFGWSEPAHLRLRNGFDAAIHRTLVATNWVRTAAWSVRASLTLWMAWRMLLA